jgi:hypothetical protein
LEFGARFDLVHKQNEHSHRRRRSLLADDNEIRHASSINIGALSLNTYNNFILK